MIKIVLLKEATSHLPRESLFTIGKVYAEALDLMNMTPERKFLHDDEQIIKIRQFMNNIEISKDEYLANKLKHDLLKNRREIVKSRKKFNKQDFIDGAKQYFENKRQNVLATKWSWDTEQAIQNKINKINSKEQEVLTVLNNWY